MCKNALRSYADQGIIPSIRNPARQRLFDVDSYLAKNARPILERLLCGDKLAVVVTHRDRLARFGIDALQFLIEHNGGQFVVLDPTVGASREAELTA
jgi:predicted site-specific integrase-resolvase